MNSKHQSLGLAVLLCFSCCTKPEPPIINPPRIPSVAMAKAARQSALHGNITAIDTMVGWAIEHTPLDEWGDSETARFWQGLMIRAANKKGIKTFYAPDCGIYKGRIAKERIKP